MMILESNVFPSVNGLQALCMGSEYGICSHSLHCSLHPGVRNVNHYVSQQEKGKILFCWRLAGIFKQKSGGRMTRAGKWEQGNTMLTNKNESQRNPQKQTYKSIPESQDIWLRHPRRSPIPRSETELKMIILILQEKLILKKVCIWYTLETATTSFKVKIILQNLFQTPQKRNISTQLFVVYPFNSRTYFDLGKQ